MTSNQVRLTVATANIGRGVSHVEARKNIAAVMHRFQGASIGWQEIDEDDEAREHQLLHAYLRRVSRADPDTARTASLRAVGWAQATPLFVPPGWRILERKIEQTCGGRGKPAPKPHTPHRVCVSTLLEHERSGLRLVRKNGHYPRDEISDLWEECDASWRRITREWRDRGYAQIDTRDVNKARRQPLHPSERLLLGAGLDKITFVPGSEERGIRVHKAAPGRKVPLTIDGHDALGITLSITPPKGGR